MTKLARTLATLVLATSALAGADAATAFAKPKKPQQVVPTGAEDAPNAPAPDPSATLTLEQATSRSSEGLTVVQNPDGSESVDLQGRFQNAMIQAPTKDGGVVTGCATNLDAKRPARRSKAKPTKYQQAVRSGARPLILPAGMGPVLPAPRALEVK
jgi:hypothetical protein